jgi:TolB-like protein
MGHILRITALTLLVVLSPGLAQAGPGTLAILYFDNQGNPELEPLKVGLAQMLITDLRGTAGVTVVERAHLQDLLDELELGHSGVTDPDTAAKLGKLLGAEWMLLGSYFELLGTLRIDARLVKVETGEILHAHGVNDTSRAFMDMEKSIAGSFRSHLEQQASADPVIDGPTGFADAGSGGEGGAGDALADGGQDDTPRTRGGDGASAAVEPPPAADPAVAHPDAQVLGAAVTFSEGLIHLDRSDVPRARESFQQALAANPQLDAAREALATLDI